MHTMPHKRARQLDGTPCCTAGLTECCRKGVNRAEHFDVGIGKAHLNLRALRNASYDMLALAWTMADGGETPTLKRAQQLETKNAGFLKQSLTDGIIEKSPLKDLAAEKPKLDTPVESGPKDSVAATRHQAIRSGIGQGNCRRHRNRGAGHRCRAVCPSLQGPDENHRRWPGDIRGLLCLRHPGAYRPGAAARRASARGRQVLSKPEDSTEPAGQGQSYRNVINTVATLDQQVYAVQIMVQGQSAPTTIIATPNHPFWVRDRGWVEVRDLKKGDQLMASNGEWAHVNLLKKERYKLSVYNLEVEDFHTYFVTAHEIWVHNCNQNDAQKVEVQVLPAKYESAQPQQVTFDGVLFEGQAPELEARQALARAGIDSANLPAEANGTTTINRNVLEKYKTDAVGNPIIENGEIKFAGDPDILLDTGEAADIFSPITNQNRSVAITIADKSKPKPLSLSWA